MGGHCSQGLCLRLHGDQGDFEEDGYLQGPRVPQGVQGRVLLPKPVQAPGGRVLPPARHQVPPFARPEGDNPILPNGHGIWKMVEPPQSLKLAMNTMNRITSSLQSEWAFGDDLTLYNYAQDVNQAIGEVLNSP